MQKDVRITHILTMVFHAVKDRYLSLSHRWNMTFEMSVIFSHSFS